MVRDNPCPSAPETLPGFSKERAGNSQYREKTLF